MHNSLKEGLQWGKKAFSHNSAESETREGQRKKFFKTAEKAMAVTYERMAATSKHLGGGRPNTVSAWTFESVA